MHNQLAIPTQRYDRSDLLQIPNSDSPTARSVSLRAWGASRSGAATMTFASLLEVANALVVTYYATEHLLRNELRHEQHGERRGSSVREQLLGGFRRPKNLGEAIALAKDKAQALGLLAWAAVNLCYYASKLVDGTFL